ncbi:helix-turn-helix domain-containing protein [Colwellia sp. M166]|uniref:LexA family protein n=1 Tax=Colwellia sp. M166 TaxID=2583805 RepID=UPI00211F106A|nr:LexA family transcriptional regulator [Colwellia sp. M166]UUO22863.1 helix-turn-helix domain-containing protein [Colwellia sp. M166]
MDIAERIKKRRLQLGLTQAELAEAALTSQTALQKIEAGLTKSPRNIKQLAAALNTSPEFLQFGVGDIDNGVVVAAANNYLPLVSMVQAGAWSEIQEPPVSDTKLYPCPVNCSKYSFVVRVEGDSMMNAFVPGDLLYVDPESQPINGSFVIARLDDENQATFKQLIIDGNKKYLKALNPDWPNKFIEINGNCTVVGKVVFAGKEL